MLRCSSFSSLQRWNRAPRNTLECCQGNLCGTTMWPQARLNAICCNGLHLRITFLNGCIKLYSFAMGCMEVSRQARCNICVAARCLCCSLCSSLHDDATSLHDDATHTALQRVALRCSTSSRFLCAAGPSRGGHTFSPASLCSSSCPRMSLLKRPSPTQTSARPRRLG